MNTLPAPTPPASPPQLRRDASRQAIAGVASGLGEHLGISVTFVRVAFVLLTIFGAFSGVLLYAVLWVMVPAATHEEAVGLEAASRTGKRPPRRSSPVDPGIVLSIGMIIIGIGWIFFSDTMVSRNVFWPLVLGGVGVVLIWLQSDHGARSTLPHDASWWQRLTRGSGPASLVRLAGGLLLFGLGGSWLLASQVGVEDLPVVLGAALALLGAVLVVAAPWLHGVRTRLRRADEERMRAEAKADMAAHLHDSVLQTLTLIQRQASDSDAVATLARRQERELRGWLYGEQEQEQTLKGALAQIRSDVEANFPVAVEVVCVGDGDLDDNGRALVLAAREAVTNAAKHAGVDLVDVYAEAEPEAFEVFVRDRGAGFDPDHVPGDRMGVRESIHARMERHGGSAHIRTAAGEGTEVRLVMNR